MLAFAGRSASGEQLWVPSIGGDLKFLRPQYPAGGEQKQMMHADLSQVAYKQLGAFPAKGNLNFCVRRTPPRARKSG